MDNDQRVIGVFGANGFIGRALVDRLASQGRHVVAFGRAFAPEYYASLPDNVEVRTVNFNDSIAVQAIMQDVTHVVQLVNSSAPGLGNSRAIDDMHANVLPHVAFIESCMMSRVRSLIFVSSGGTVYGEPAYVPINEQHPLRPINSYGLTKMIVEQYLRMLTRGSAMGAVSLRVSNPFGPGQTLKKGQGLIASLLQSHARGTPATIFGDGSSERDYLFIEDLIDAIICTLDAPPMREEINIGSGTGRTIREVIAAVEHVLGKKLLIEYTDDRPTDTRSNVLDCGKARRLLDWSAQTDFETALSRTIRGA